MPRRTQRYSKIGDTMETIDLSGKWNYKTDIDNSQTKEYCIVCREENGSGGGM